MKTTVIESLYVRVLVEELRSNDGVNEHVRRTLIKMNDDGVNLFNFFSFKFQYVSIFNRIKDYFLSFVRR